MKFSKLAVPFAVAFAFASPAHATPKHKPPVSAPSNQVNNGVGIGNTNNNRNESENNNNNKAVANSAAKAGAVSGSSSQGGKAAQQQGQGQSQEATNAGNASVSVTGDSYQQARIPVNTAFAAGLVASYGTCLGSASGGVQGAAIGLSFGTTTLDQGCHLIRRMNALIVMGLPQAALTLACIEDDAMYTAIRTAGYYCAEADRPVVQPVATPVVQSAPLAARNDRN